MRRLRTLPLIIFAALFAVSCGGAGLPTAATADPLAGQYIVNGGGGALDNVRAVADAFQKIHPTITWQGLGDVGSDAGVNLAVSGETDLGYISRDLRDAEKGKVESVSIGASGTAVAVSASNPVKALTKDQVARIFTGQITDWKDVGGTAGKIRVLIRESGSSTRSAFEAYFYDGKKPTYAPAAIEVTKIDETVKAIDSFKESIGMVTMNASTFGNAQIAFVTIDGVQANRENLTSGKYQVRRPLYFVYNPATVKPAIRAFLDFVKGPEGQKILAGL
ncbi:MAG: substrate-binding domain-containing protein [Candidatus Limnocylindria bacterium]